MESDLIICQGDCLVVMKDIPDNSIDAVVTDPPYLLEFMGKKWDSKPAHEHLDWHKAWATEALRVLKPGGHLLSFGGTRTWHRLAVAIEDAGFEIRDSIAWLYGQGFPKAKTVLKPAFEPIVVARKKGKGGLNIEACRVEAVGRPLRVLDAKETDNAVYQGRMDGSFAGGSKAIGTTDQGRWPTNVLLDEHAAEQLDDQTGLLKSGKAAPAGHKRNQPPGEGIYGGGKGLWTEEGDAGTLYGDEGGASRFFPVFKYQSKAPKRERPVLTKEDGSRVMHPTVKPVELMRWLLRLVAPEGGIVLDPFAGSGTTGEAARLEGMSAILIEKEDDYHALMKARLG